MSHLTNRKVYREVKTPYPPLLQVSHRTTWGRSLCRRSHMNRQIVILGPA